MNTGFFCLASTAAGHINEVMVGRDESSWSPIKYVYIVCHKQGNKATKQIKIYTYN